MSDSLVEKIAAAVLYEGYILYPYRASSRKNRERFTFGRVYPKAYSEDQNGAEPCVTQTECLVTKRAQSAALSVRVRFLQAMAREVGAPETPEHAFAAVPELEVDGRLFQTWDEAVEREVEVSVPTFSANSVDIVRFSFPETRSFETLRDRHENVVGLVRRRQAAIIGTVEARLAPIDAETWRVTVKVTNETAITPEQMAADGELLRRTLASTHALLEARGAEFLSLTDPPAAYVKAAAGCVNTGAWPVLVGDPAKRERGTMLASPIILPDYPQIAPESAGDLHDGTEIDEILSLRVLTMTEGEKREMRSVDEYARRILERTESLHAEDFLRMHGTMRDVQIPGMGDFFEEGARLTDTIVDGVTLKTGDRVRIRPGRRADAMDLMLAGRIAMIEAIEQDAEGRVHLALVVDDDPGRELGLLRQPGHRFFYEANEVEPLTEEDPCAS
jgi:hydrogenase maturation protease